MVIIELIIVFAAIFLGARLGGVGLVLQVGSACWRWH